MRMETVESEVLVAGLGPVGSVAALSLARAGISVAAVEAGASGSATDLRASTFHAATLELLDRLGAAEAILRIGLRAPEYQYRDRQTGEVFRFDLGEIADHTLFPYRLQCEQHHLAHDLAARLAAEPAASLTYGQRLLFVEQDAVGVTAYVETPTAVVKHRARYLIGADGANSITRKVLGLDFPGWTHHDKFLCFSTAHPLERQIEGLCHVNYIADPQEWTVLLRVPTLWRILVPADEATPDAHLLSDENKDAVFRRILASDLPVETRHRTIYRVHQRVVPSFVNGRVCLVGDAAHLNSPMGGFGMNSGIHDALNLSEKLVRVLRHGADVALLDLYDRQRRTVTQDFIQAQSIENTEMMRSGWGAVSEKRRDQMRRLRQDDVARRAFLLRQSMFTSLADAAAIH
jgi:3-(3-hydroxy-phenyl)propionate hydroxylase